MVSNESKLKDRISYLDKLVSAFVDHEKSLNDLILRLTETVEKISEVVEKTQRNRGAKENKKSFVFIKIKADIPPEEQERIRESLSR